MKTLDGTDLAVLRVWVDLQPPGARVSLATFRAVLATALDTRRQLRLARTAADRAHAELLARGIALPPDSETI